jgi:rod shape-determining protein MreC
MQKVSATVAEGTATAINRATTSYDDLLAENDELRSQINELQQQLSDYYQYKQENEQLKNFLELKSDNPDYQFAYGSVIARDSSDYFYRFRVDKGTLDGVSVNDPVVTEAGLVGWVSSVSAMDCTVTTILSPETNIAALDKVSRDTGVITSEITLADEGLIRLYYLENDNTVQQGDMIVTSGIGGIFPKNLLIGKAVSVQSSETDVSLYATVEPYVDLKNVKDVLIITNFDGQGEVLTDDTTEEG